MTLYIDTKLNFTDGNVVSTVGTWHPSLPLLAVGSYNQEKGGFVTIFQENVSLNKQNLFSFVCLLPNYLLLISFRDSH